MKKMLVEGKRTLIGWIILLIAVLTILAGGVQLTAPGMALDGLGLEADASTLFAFRLASLLILCFGGLLLHEVVAEDTNRRVVLWVGLQKLGAALLLLIALIAQELDPLAWGVVAWDGLCGILLLTEATTTS